MRFTYTYRSSDGQRHTAEIEAESRDAAFTKVRSELGIKPIKVTAAAGDHVTGDGSSKSAASPRWGVVPVIAFIATIVLIALGVWWWAARSASAPYQPPSEQEQATYTVNTPQGAASHTTATPLSRQMIPGDRQRIEGAVGSPKPPAERLLARFAEPGRAVVALPDERPTEAEFAACLREPIKVAGTDFTEAVDLKRIVTGMKREMRAYIAGGGTAEQYLSELVKRQKLEISYRENAERRLTELLNGENQKLETRNPKLKTAYGYWLKANASLKSMGIYELPLPDALQGYQASLGLDE